MRAWIRHVLGRLTAFASGPDAPVPPPASAGTPGVLTVSRSSTPSLPPWSPELDGMREDGASAARRAEFRRARRGDYPGPTEGFRILTELLLAMEALGRPAEPRAPTVDRIARL